MRYFNPQTNSTIGFQGLRELFPNISLPKGIDLPDLGWFVLHPSTPPEITEEQELIESSPLNVDGKWTEAWTIQAAPVVVPDAIDAIQGLLVLDQAGLADSYMGWANSPDRTFSERAFIDKAKTWERQNPVLVAAALSMGISESQLDQLFIAGSKIKP